MKSQEVAERRTVRRASIFTSPTLPFSGSPFVPNYLTSIVAAAVLILGCVTLSLGQSDPGIDTDVGNPGLDGRNTIRGQIYYPSGRPLDKRIIIKMSSVRGGASSTMSNDNGAFAFRRLIDGTYHLEIDAGKEYETVDERVDIIDTGKRSSNVMTVNIQLRPRAAIGKIPETLDAALAGIPEGARQLYTQALSSAKANDHKKAIEQLKKAVALYPNFALAWNELGIQNMVLGRYQEAEEGLRATLKLAPDAISTRLNYGFVLLQQKIYSPAEAEFRLVLQKNDTLAMAHLYRGRALLGLFKDTDAEKELRRAIELGGEETYLGHRYLGALYSERGDKARAVQELETYLRLVPNARNAEQIREIIKGLRAK